MIRHRLSGLGTGVVVAGVVVLGVVTAGPAQATTPDEAFINAVKAMDIPFGPDVDLPKVGHQVCDMLTTNLAGNPNPVPVVRGVVSTLQNNGLERGQAVGLMRAAVVVYCPEHRRLIGR